MKTKKMILTPWAPDLPQLLAPEFREDGTPVSWGFLGNASKHPDYVTDGRLLLLAAALMPDVTLAASDAAGLMKHVSNARMEEVWKSVSGRLEMPVELLGFAPLDDWAPVAFLRGPSGQSMVVNAYLLALAFKAVRPDGLFAKTPAIPTKELNEPLAFRRNGKLVGFLATMRMN